jgi:beta-N-acetylhexosaminidase
MEITLEQAVRQKIIISFKGTRPPQEVLDALQRQPLAGVTLFRSLNVQNPAQVRQLTGLLQQAVTAGGNPPLIIAADQEGGQLNAIGEGVTLFPGNMALGAAGSTRLAYQAGYATGLELAAMGVNVNFAPVCDVCLNPENPVVGTRSFGDDPQEVSRLCAAMVEGLQQAGVAAVAKHFPGHGDTGTDSHFATPVISHDRERLRQVELAPFSAAARAGVRMVMTSHVALSAIDGDLNLPATLSPAILKGLLRGELGFAGLIISDAMDMRAIQQGEGLIVDAIAAATAGVDLLLLNHGPEEVQRVSNVLLQAAQRNLLSKADLLASARRVFGLKHWLEQSEQPGLEVVGCAEHQALAQEIASQAVTLVRDRDRMLPLHLPSGAKLLAIQPMPTDLTPADTSSTVPPSLATALRSCHPQVDELVIPIDPSIEEVAALHEKARSYDLVVVGTVQAQQFKGQAALINALLADGQPVIAAALRMPHDLLAYPSAPVCLCSYSLLPPAMEALAQAIFGRIPIRGRLPVSIPGIKD